jgi:hypothetical protein
MIFDVIEYDYCQQSSHYPGPQSVHPTDVIFFLSVELTNGFLVVYSFGKSKYMPYLVFALLQLNFAL